MTSLLKEPLCDVLPVEWTPTEREPAISPENPVVEELERRTAELEAALLRAQAEKDAASAEAYVTGKNDAEAAFQRDEGLRLKALEAALTMTVEEARAQFKDLERLALLLCNTSLEAVLDRPTDFRELVARAISLQMRGLRREAILGVRVSAEDFNDETALRDLEDRLGSYGRVCISHDPSLASGESHIELRLGCIEISLPRYWNELNTALRSLVASGDAP